MKINAPKCRFCGDTLSFSLVDLGSTPLANSFLKQEELTKAEPSYPLHARVCGSCFLVQVEPVVPASHIFGDYLYFSSYSASWVAHAQNFAALATDRWHLGVSSLVIEIASNDGYLLRHFAQKDIPVLGIEPAANVAAVAEAAGVRTKVAFFGKETGRQLAAEGYQADLVVANNVLAHVPDINDFLSGFSLIMKPAGVLSIEFPHLLKLLDNVLFDTIYHEHYSYLSLLTVERMLAQHNLRAFDVEYLLTHGGSLRVWIGRADGVARKETAALQEIRQQELNAGLNNLSAYQGFSRKVDAAKTSLRTFLEDAKLAGKQVVVYGAPAKGNTLLNTCDIDDRLIAYAVDVSPHKQGRFLPGSHLPIYAPEQLRATRPDYVLILPWNLEIEIIEKNKYIREWGGRFVLPLPETRVLP